MLERFIHMKKIKKIKKPYKKIAILFIAIYVIYTLIAQQKTLNAYTTEQRNYSNQIKQEQANKDTLLKTKDRVNSTEYIEDVAREKLGMYLPNERVYFDAAN